MAEIIDVKLLLINTLEEAYKYPVFLQGSLSDEDKYPENFFTYWNNNTSDGDFYDNQNNKTNWDLDLNFYSNDPTLVNTIFDSVKPTLRAVGFIVDGLGYDLFSDEKTHIGRGINLIYIQKVR